MSKPLYLSYILEKSIVCCDVFYNGTFQAYYDCYNGTLSFIQVFAIHFDGSVQERHNSCALASFLH